MKKSNIYIKSEKIRRDNLILQSKKFKVQELIVLKKFGLNKKID